MGVDAGVALVSAVIAAYTAAFHLWIHGQRPHEPTHRWFGLTALAVAGYGVGSAAVFEAATPGRGLLAQRFLLACGITQLLCFARFTRHFVGREWPRLDRAATIVLGSLGALVVATPLGFAGPAAPRPLGASGRMLYEAPLAPVGWVLSVCLIAYAVSILARYLAVRDAPGTDVRALVAGFLTWFACGVNDLLVVSRVYDGPYLLATGFAGFVLALSTLLVGRLVRSVDDVEHAAQRLHDLVDARTAELREKELWLAQGEKMAAVGTLAAGLAHEINNPIAFVSSSLNRLEELWDKPPSPGAAERGEVTELLAECREGIARVGTIVTNLLRFARRGDGRRVPVDLAAVVRSVLPMLRHEAQARARLEPSLAPVPPVLGDDALLGQVVLNLVLNALQAIGEGAAERHAVRVATRSESGRVLLTVADDGPGIPSEVLPRIFDPFFTTKVAGEGTGLGLAISHQIVTRHGGRISVSSGPAGTEFVVELPPAQSSPSQNARSSS